MGKQTNDLYEFGDCRLDVAEHLLWRGEKVIPLTPKVFETLQLFVESGGRLIEKDELMKEIWADSFVEEANLPRNISTLRKALADGENGHRYIETVPKVGYRFVAPISKVPNQAAQVFIQRHVAARIVTEHEDSHTGSDKLEFVDVVANEQPDEHLAEHQQASLPAHVDNQHRRRNVILVAAGVACLSIVIVFALVRRGSRSPTTANTVESVAVLPFANTGGDLELEYLSEGLTENLINRLSRASHLKIIAHSSVARYKNKEVDAQRIGRELGVQAILIGKVRQRGNDLTVNAELVDARDGSHIWGEQYDRSTTDLNFLQKELAQHIANGIKVQFSGEEQKQIARSYTDNAEAYRLYLKGRYFWNKRTETDLRKGIEYFQKSLEQDPNYAQAYAGLADSYIILANWNLAPPAEAYGKAKAAALKALELDDQLAEAHTSLAYTTLLYEWDWKRSEAQFRQAIQLNPNYASAHHFYSICLMTAGRYDEALVEIKRAQELDPLSLIINDVLGWIYYESRQFDNATQQFGKTLEMDPNYVPALLDLGTTYLQTGKYREAIAQFQKARDVGQENGVVLSDLAQAYALSGQPAEARKILKQLQRPAPEFFVSLWDLSLVYLALGDKAKAVELLEKAADERVGWVVRLGVDPAFDNLRGDSRFEKLKQRVGVPVK